MKHTNLFLDERVLERAKAISGINTYSSVVNLALRDFVRRRTYERIPSYVSGSDLERDSSPGPGASILEKQVREEP